MNKSNNASPMALLVLPALVLFTLMQLYVSHFHSEFYRSIFMRRMYFLYIILIPACIGISFGALAARHLLRLSKQTFLFACLAALCSLAALSHFAVVYLDDGLIVGITAFFGLIMIVMFFENKRKDPYGVDV